MPAAAPRLRDLAAYFLRLGALGFGGPIALAGRMRRDLVDARGWIAKDDYDQGLALAQLAPGPLAAQLAMYLGWVRAGALGATVVGVAFVLPSLLMVMALSALYVRWGGVPGMQAAFYGIGAAVIAIIVRSAWKLAKSTVGVDRLLIVLLAISAAVTAWTGREILAVFIASGVVAWLVKTPPRFLRRGAPAAGIALAPFVTGLHGAASPATLGRIFVYFAEAGSVVFGSGLAIVPFLHGGVVDQLHWLDERQFLDAVAVAMITPGPVVITVAFIGWLVGGPVGATLAAAGVFLPCWAMVLVLAPWFRKLNAMPAVRAFVGGVTASACGAIAGATWVLGRRAIVDVPTALIAVAAFLALRYAKKIPEPVVILVAAAIGLAWRAINPTTS